jgi:hypothetical protein
MTSRTNQSPEFSRSKNEREASSKQIVTYTSEDRTPVTICSFRCGSVQCTLQPPGNAFLLISLLLSAPTILHESLP